MPANVGSSAMNAVTCVSANTKTRSKNSSSGDTRASASAGRTILRGFTATVGWLTPGTIGGQEPLPTIRANSHRVDSSERGPPRLSLRRKRLICREFRADGRTRTGDPFITSEVLYQLSYVGGAGPRIAREARHSAGAARPRPA